MCTIQRIFVHSEIKHLPSNQITIYCIVQSIKHKALSKLHTKLGKSWSWSWSWSWYWYWYW